MRRLVAPMLAAAALLFGMAHAPPAPPAGPPPSAAAASVAPRGMVAFVEGEACPDGWQVAALAAGRLLVGTEDPQRVGRTVGVPLAAAEDRQHAHPLGDATLALPYKSISAANGGNHAGAAAGPQPVTGSAGPAPSGLPFIQLTTCVSP
jgi:hypothetical protein